LLQPVSIFPAIDAELDAEDFVPAKETACAPIIAKMEICAQTTFAQLELEEMDAFTQLSCARTTMLAQKMCACPVLDVPTQISPVPMKTNARLISATSLLVACTQPWIATTAHPVLLIAVFPVI
jgi:hypothetical protein